MNGSRLAVVGSGISSMSDAWIPFQPAIDEPSNAWPDSNLSLSKTLAGTVTCCSLPRVSVQRRSTNLTSLSLMSFRTSAGLVVIGNALLDRGGRAAARPAFGEDPMISHFRAIGAGV